MTEFKEAKEEFGKMVRWTEQPKKPDENTIFIGNVLQGILVNVRRDVGQNESSVYEIKTAQGELLSMWGSALLDGKFAQVPMGSEVRVTCLGMTQPKTAKGRPYMNFKVEYAKPVVSMTEATTAKPATAGNVAAPAAAPAAAAGAVDEGY